MSNKDSTKPQSGSKNQGAEDKTQGLYTVGISKAESVFVDSKTEKCLPKTLANDPLLVYEDNRRNRRGPFRFKIILEWLASGYFGKDLKVCLDSDPDGTPYSCLEDFIEKYCEKGSPPPGFSEPEKSKAVETSVASLAMRGNDANYELVDGNVRVFECIEKTNSKRKTLDAKMIKSNYNNANEVLVSVESLNIPEIFQHCYYTNLLKLIGHPNIVHVEYWDKVGSKMIIRQYSKTLAEVVNENYTSFFTRGRVGSKTVLYLSSYTISIIKGMFRGLKAMIKAGMSYDDMSSKSIVFDVRDRDCKTPQFLDLYHFGERDSKKLHWIKCKAVLSTFLKDSPDGSEILSADVRRLLEDLKKISPDMEKKLLEHPSLLERGMKLHRVIRIRNYLHDAKYTSLGLRFQEEVCGKKSWKEIVENSKINYLVNTLKYRTGLGKNEEYTADCWGLLKFIRNIYQHWSANLKSIGEISTQPNVYLHSGKRAGFSFGAKETSAAFPTALNATTIEADIEELFPNLMSYLFKNVESKVWLTDSV